MFPINLGTIGSQFRRPFVFKIYMPTANSGDFTVPCAKNFNFNYNVDWIEVSAPGDPPIENPDKGIIQNQTGNCVITFASNKEAYYKISISGLFPGISFEESAEPEKLYDIIQWGDNIWQSMNSAFLGCINLEEYSATDNPNLSQVTDMSSMFRDCTLFKSTIGGWDTSNVTNMSRLFENCVQFDINIGSWNTSNVTNMNNMFYGSTNFDQNIGGWNTANVTNMDGMFFNASTFNQYLDGWCVTNIASEPTDFDTGASAWSRDRPIWGTCP